MSDLGIDLPATIADLERDEGVRLFVYDDATGLPIKPGTHVIGHPTLGVGRALDVEGLTIAESRYLLDNDIETFATKLTSVLPFWTALNDVRRRVLLEMAFNLGLGGLLSFKSMLASVAAGDWSGAVSGMKSSHWHDQVGARAVRLEAHMLNGV